MKRIAVPVICLFVLVACGPSPERSSSSYSTPGFTPGVPQTSASAITSPPTNMEDINSQTHLYGTGADPEMITLGPRECGQPGWPPYPGKTSMEFELPHGTPILAPIKMVMIAFDNRNAIFRIGSEGQRMEPFNDLELCFESLNPDWPGMIVCVYHLLRTPLLLGHNTDAACSEVEEWQGTIQAQGRLFYEYRENIVPESTGSSPCCSSIGRSVERGQLIGFAGSVGSHSMAAFRFKVSHESINPLVRKGDNYLHWAQPGSFFFWKCYAPEINFPDGVLAYPFECGGFQIPSEQHNIDFKYSPDEQALFEKSILLRERKSNMHTEPFAAADPGIVRICARLDVLSMLKASCSP